MRDDRVHPYIPRLQQQLAAGRCSRPGFLRTATLLGVAAGAAHAMAGRCPGLGCTTSIAPRARLYGH
jgi:peptide/nickel transport system substrate-binding protein